MRSLKLAVGWGSAIDIAATKTVTPSSILLGYCIRSGWFHLLRLTYTSTTPPCIAQDWGQMAGNSRETTTSVAYHHLDEVHVKMTCSTRDRWKVSSGVIGNEESVFNGPREDQAGTHRRRVTAQILCGMVSRQKWSVIYSQRLSHRPR